MRVPLVVFLVACGTAAPTSVVAPTPETHVERDEPRGFPLVIERGEVDDPAGDDVFFAVQPRGGRIIALAISPRGDLLAACHDLGQVSVAHVSSGNLSAARQIETTVAHRCNALAFDRSGTRLLIGLASAGAVVWDLVRDTWVRTPSSRDLPVFAADGESILYASEWEGECFIYRHHLTRGLTNRWAAPSCRTPMVIEGGWASAAEESVVAFSNAGEPRWTHPAPRHSDYGRYAEADPTGRFVGVALRNGFEILRASDGRALASRDLTTQPQLRWSLDGPTLWSIELAGLQHRLTAWGGRDFSRLGFVDATVNPIWNAHGARALIADEGLDLVAVERGQTRTLVERVERVSRAEPTIDVSGERIAYVAPSALPRVIGIDGREHPDIRASAGSLVRPEGLYVDGSTILMRVSPSLITVQDHEISVEECVVLGQLASGRVVGRNGPCDAPLSDGVVLGFTSDRSAMVVLRDGRLETQGLDGRVLRRTRIDPDLVEGCPGERCGARVVQHGATTWLQTTLDLRTLFAAMRGARRAPAQAPQQLPKVVRLRGGRAETMFEGALAFESAGDYVIAQGTDATAVFDATSGREVRRTAGMTPTRISPSGESVLMVDARRGHASMVRLPDEELWEASFPDEAEVGSVNAAGVHVDMPGHTELWTWEGERVELALGTRVGRHGDVRVTCDQTTLTRSDPRGSEALGRCAWVQNILVTEDLALLRGTDEVVVVELATGERRTIRAARSRDELHVMALRGDQLITTPEARALLSRRRGSITANRIQPVE